MKIKKKIARPGFLETNLSQNSDLFKSEILLKFKKSQKNAFLEKNLAQILTQLEKNLKSLPHQAEVKE